MLSGEDSYNISLVSSQLLRKQTKRKCVKKKKKKSRTFLVVQWLVLCAPSAGVLGPIPGQGTRLHMQQLKKTIPQPRPTVAK